jgi:bacillolysin
MPARPRGTAVVVALTVMASLFADASVAAAASPEPNGYRVTSGPEAAAFALPADVRLISTWTDAQTGLTYSRYQQYAAPLKVFVDGGQITVVRRGERQLLVIGKHYPALRVANAPALTPAQAISKLAASAPASLGASRAALTYTTDLRVDPETAHLSYRIAAAAPGALTYFDLDANTGTVISSWSGVETDAPSGTGVKGDVKSLAGDALTGANALSVFDSASNWSLVSATHREETYDAHGSSQYVVPLSPMSDTDGVWSEARKVAATDAQYYAALTDNFYVSKMGFDLVACLGHPIRSVVHYSTSYANAFWEPDSSAMYYGDGDGSTMSEMSGAQDVVSHELTHAVTDCRAPLDYRSQSGALNEAFSDMMATAAEFALEEPNTSNCRRAIGQTSCADWWLGEDLVIGGSDYAIRSLSNPAVLGQPAHFSQRTFANTAPKNCGALTDYCGVHTNSGIANHAFYLMSMGGRNARCSGPSDTAADCDVLVPGVGVSDAAHVFFAGWQFLTNDATFCEARDAVVAQAALVSDVDRVAADLAWQAVGVASCGTPGSTFGVTLTNHTAALQAGGSSDVTIDVHRVSSTAPISFSVSDPAPATASFAPNPEATSDSATRLRMAVAGDAAPGVYPLSVTATDGATTQKLSLVLIFDNDAPTAQVSAVSMAPGDSVASDGHVPLHVAWSATDVTSGIASTALTDGAATIPGAPPSSTDQAADGTHSIVATATDAAGNTGTSAPFGVQQSSAQETAATLTKKLKWLTSSAPTPWGTTLFSKTNGATASYTFDGTSIAWVSARSPRSGKAKVYIDGVLKSVVDLKSALSASSVIVYVASGLSNGQHTIRIFVNGTSGRPRVDIDGFVALKPAP